MPAKAVGAGGRRQLAGGGGSGLHGGPAARLQACWARSSPAAGSASGPGPPRCWLPDPHPVAGPARPGPQAAGRQAANCPAEPWPLRDGGAALPSVQRERRVAFGEGAEGGVSCCRPTIEVVERHPSYNCGRWRSAGLQVPTARCRRGRCARCRAAESLGAAKLSESGRVQNCLPPAALLSCGCRSCAQECRCCLACAHPAATAAGSMQGEPAPTPGSHACCPACGALCRCQSSAWHLTNPEGCQEQAGQSLGDARGGAHAARGGRGGSS